MNYTTFPIGQLIRTTLLSIILTPFAYGQQPVDRMDRGKTTDSTSLWSHVHIHGSGPLIASGLPIFINGQEATNQVPFPEPASIKSAQLIKRGDPRLVRYGLKGINGVVVIEATTDSIQVGQPLPKN